MDQFILDTFDDDEIIKIIMLYVNLAVFTGDENFALTADSLIKAVYAKDNSKEQEVR